MLYYVILYYIYIFIILYYFIFFKYIYIILYIYIYVNIYSLLYIINNKIYIYVYIYIYYTRRWDNQVGIATMGLVNKLGPCSLAAGHIVSTSHEIIPKDP
jgi:hypothetical protein